MGWRWRRAGARDATAPAVEPGPAHEPGPAPAPRPGRDGWWFAPAGTAARSGRTESCAELPAPGEVGLHATRTVLDALEFARSPHLCRVRLSGDVVERGPLIAATERTVLWCLDPTPLLRSVLLEIVRGALREGAPPEIDALASRALSTTELASLTARCDRACEAVLDAESRVSDAEWRHGQRGGDVALAAVRSARADAAAAKAHHHAIGALRLAAGGGPHELGSSIELALRASAWFVAASLDAISARDLDELTRETHRHWAETLDARMMAIAAARGVDRVGAHPLTRVHEVAQSAAASARPPTVIAPISMELPTWRATPRVTVPSVEPFTRETAWRHAVRDVLARLGPVVRRGAILDAPSALRRRGDQRVVVARIEPFDRASAVASAISEILTPDGRATGAIVLGAATLESSATDVVLSPELSPWASGWRRAVLADAIEASWETRSLVDERSRDREVTQLDDDHGESKWARTTARCSGCGSVYELATDDPIEGARCRCGAVGLERLGHASPDETFEGGDAVACRACRRFFLRPLATEHACCPFCLRVDTPLSL